MGNFQEAIDTFESILANRPSEIGVLMSLAQTHLDIGRDEVSTGFLTRAEESFGACVRVALKVIRENPGFRGLAWKTVADAIFYLSKQSSYADAENIRTLLKDAVSLITANTSDQLSGILTFPSLGGESLVGGRQTLEVAMVAYDHVISLSSSEASATGSSWYDLGIALSSWSIQITSKEDQERADKQAVACLTKALREDPGNDTYWNALGYMNFVAQPKTAQHAYIKALEIDNKVSDMLPTLCRRRRNHFEERGNLDESRSSVPLP
jgi:superkiller protein 3